MIYRILGIIYKRRFAGFTLATIFIVGCLFISSTYIETQRAHTRQHIHINGGGVKNATASSPSTSQSLSSAENLQETYQRNLEAHAPVVLKDRVVSISTATTLDIILSSTPSSNETEREIVNPHDFQYYHNAPSACQGREVELLIGAMTRAENFLGRRTLRDTWAEYGKNPNHNTVVLYFLGRPRVSFFQRRIDAEAERYGDIIQEEFFDTYRNLSLKSVALMKWASVYCPNSTFVLKADDDMYINVPRLLRDLRLQITKTPTFIMGRVHTKVPPVRNKEDKWYVTEDEYSDKYFPEYVSGTAYSLTTSAAKKIYTESLFARDFFLEDIFLTGMLADMAGIPRINNMKFNHIKPRPRGCAYKHRITGHKNDIEEIKRIHRELHDPFMACFFPNKKT